MSRNDDALYQLIAHLLRSNVPRDPSPSLIHRVVDELLEDIMRQEPLARALVRRCVMEVAAEVFIRRWSGGGPCPSDASEPDASGEGLASEVRRTLDPLDVSVRLEELMAYSAYSN